MLEKQNPVNSQTNFRVFKTFEKVGRLKQPTILEYLKLDFWKGLAWNRFIIG